VTESNWAGASGAKAWLVGRYLGFCLLLGREPIPLAVADQFFGTLLIGAVGGKTP
jgi:hypothetical protein